MLVELYGDPESDNYAGSAGDMAMPVETAAAGTPPDGISAERVFVERFKGYVEKDGPQRPLLSEWWGAPNSRNLKEGTGVEFFPLSTATAPSLRPCACARFIADVGPAPKERGYWFNQEKVEDVRARIDALCGDIYRRWRHGYSPETEGQGQGLGGATRSRYVRLHGAHVRVWCHDSMDPAYGLSPSFFQIKTAWKTMVDPGLFPIQSCP